MKILTLGKSNGALKKLVLPGFQGIPLNEVFRFVVKGFGKGVLVTRASSIAFNMLMALLPASFFLSPPAMIAVVCVKRLVRVCPSV